MTKRRRGFVDVNKNPTGYFSIECIDAETGNVVDHHEQHNMIMSTSSKVMSKVFAGASSGLINKLIVGTSGTKDESLLIPKDASDGFVKERTSIFSTISRMVDDGDTVSILLGDLIYYQPNSFDDNLYRYTGESNSNLTITDDLVLNSGYFTLVSTSPETFTTTFEIPGTIGPDSVSGSNRATITVEASSTATTFTFYIPEESGNGITGTTSYTEAGMFNDDDIFSMKTFPAKTKDYTVILRIIWKIIF